LPETSEFDRQLLLLDRISYTPSLLPFIMDNIDYLELSPDQVKALRDWRAMNAPAMLEKMHEVAQGRIELVDLTLSPNSNEDSSDFRMRYSLTNYHAGKTFWIPSPRNSGTPFSFY
jgi:hypothetical protein